MRYEYFDQPPSLYCVTTMETICPTAIIVNDIVTKNEVLFDEATGEFIVVDYSLVIEGDCVLLVRRNFDGKVPFLKRIWRKLFPLPQPHPLEKGVRLRRTALVVPKKKGKA